MCTAATYKTKDFYFGRNLDYEFSYGDQIVVVPRRFKFNFSNGQSMDSHFAMIGMAYVCDQYPLYYDAINEKGLGIAGLNFVGNAIYHDFQEGKENIAQYELIPWILGQCQNVKEVKSLLGNLNILNKPFNASLPLAQLHWIIADEMECITVESVKDGLKIYDNPVGVLTNNPPFQYQMFQLNNYMHLSNQNPKNLFSKELNLETYSRGMGGLGLPGDLSSQSRFMKVAFTKMNSISKDTESESVSQFFHILHSVEQQNGCCQVGENEFEYTIYTSCCNCNKGIYYYTTYNNHQIHAVHLFHENLDQKDFICFQLKTQESIQYQN